MLDIFSLFKSKNTGLAWLGNPTPGFSFKVDESIFPSDGFRKISDTDNNAIYQSDAVRINAEYCYSDRHDAIVYKSAVTNISNNKVRLHDCYQLDLKFLVDHDDVIINTYFGGDIEFYYPPDNFSHKSVMMSPAQRFPDPGWKIGYRAESCNGRSSDKDMPFAIIQDCGKSGGLYLSVMWSGDWYMEFFKQYDGLFHAYGGMQFLDILMEPGETIELPEILVGAFEGDLSTGENALRRYIRDTCIRKHPEYQQVPPVSFDHWFGLGRHIDEDTMISQAKRLEGLGFEYFVMDAGWFYIDDDGKLEFHYGTGNFTEIDKKKFPNGLKPLYDCIENLEMRGGLWFEPERAARESIISKEIPEAMLSTDSAGDVHYDTNMHLVNFGNPKVIDFTKKYLKKYFEELNLQWIRWDFNINPRNYWRDNDNPGRRGESELAHMHGLYEILEWINENYPQVLIEGCASGGQRMDLKTMSFSPTFWCSDQTFNAHITRYHLTAGNLIMPGIMLNRALTPILPEGEDIPDYYFMSQFGGSFAVNDPVQNWSKTTYERCKKHVKIYKQLRQFICDDYYQLLPPPKSLEDNEGWQFINPEKQRGFFQLFRSAGGQQTVTAALKGLNAKKYIITDPYTAHTEEYDVENLQIGIDFHLDNYTSIVRLFEAKE